MNKYILFFLGVFLFMGLVSSTSLGTFKQGESVNIINSCFNCTSNNVTYISYPNSTGCLIDTDPMDKVGSIFNYTSSCSQDLGNYIVYGVNDTGVWEKTYNITSTGKETPEGIVLIFFLIGFLIIIGGMLALTLNMIFRMLHLTFDATNLITMISAYFVMFGFYILEKEYLDLSIINTILSILVDVGSIVFVFVPIIIFIVCYIKGNLDKVNFGGSEFD